MVKFLNYRSSFAIYLQKYILWTTFIPLYHPKIVSKRVLKFTFKLKITFNCQLTKKLLPINKEKKIHASLSVTSTEHIDLVVVYNFSEIYTIDQNLNLYDPKHDS